MNKHHWRTITTFIIIFLSIVCGYFTVKLVWIETYDSDTHNCKDMSYQLAPLFHYLGFNASVVYGNPLDNGSEGHAWISLNGIYFDATSLWFNNENEYKVVYVDSYPYDNMKWEAASK